MERDTIIFIENWKRKRRSTYFIFCFIFFNNGFGQTLTVSTLWLYVTKLIDTEDERFYYALISAAYLFPTTLFSGVMSSYCDKTSGIKLVANFVNFLGFIGGITYMIPFSPYYAIIGNFLSGFSLILRPIMIGEMARSYPMCHIKQIFPMLHNFHCAGMAFGPGFILIFLKLNITVDRFTLTYENIAGLLRSFGCLIAFILTAFYVYNVSKEFDYKKEMVEISAGDDDDDDNSTFMSLLVKALSTRDTLYILCASFFSNMIRATFYYIFPLIIDLKLGYSAILINVCYISPILFYIVISILVFKRFHIKSMLKCAVNSWVIVSIAGLILLLLKSSSSQASNITLLIIMTIIVEMFSFGTFLYLSITLANLVQSKYQISIDSLRNQSHQSALIFGGVIASYGVSHIGILCLSLLMLIMIMIILCYIQRESIRNPKIVI